MASHNRHCRPITVGQFWRDQPHLSRWAKFGSAAAGHSLCGRHAPQPPLITPPPGPTYQSLTYKPPWQRKMKDTGTVFLGVPSKNWFLVIFMDRPSSKCHFVTVCQSAIIWSHFGACIFTDDSFPARDPRPSADPPNQILQTPEGLQVGGLRKPPGRRLPPSPFAFSVTALVGTLPSELLLASVVAGGAPVAPSLATASACTAAWPPPQQNLAAPRLVLQHQASLNFLAPYISLRFLQIPRFGVSSREFFFEKSVQRCQKWFWGCFGRFLGLADELFLSKLCFAGLFLG